MFNLTVGGDRYTQYRATIHVDKWTALCARRIYWNGRRRGASPMIARFAAAQFIADHICGNVPWKPWA